MHNRSAWVWYGVFSGAMLASLVLYVSMPRETTGWNEHPREISQAGEIGMPHPANSPANPRAHLSAIDPDSLAKLPPIDRAAPQTVETAVFALGCFWGVEALYGAQPGVIRVRCGYCGGVAPNPTYHAMQGYTESVAVDFDPQVITYAKLVDLFWAHCSPTQKAWNLQYKSAIFYDGAEQEKIALASKTALARQIGAQIAVDVIPATHFYNAEDYHQHYRLRNTHELMQEFNAIYPQAEDFLNSTAAARVNGYLSGFGSAEQLTREIDSLGLSPEGRKRLIDIVANQPTESCGL